VAAGKYQADIERLKFSANISTNGLLQDAIGRFLESGNYPAHIKKLREFARMQVLKYRNAIQDYFPEGTRIGFPSGGYSLWIELPEHINAMDLQRDALKHGVGFCPGQIFSATNHLQNFMRINCCPVWNTKIHDSIKLLGKLAEALNAVKLSV
jgi:DNA-binding transcriptional MocR family regulator